VSFLILDAPARWAMHFADSVISNKGYFAVASVLAVYFAVFGLIDAKSTQEETRASLERSVFITLVSSGNAASFVAAMKDFGPTQTMLVTKHPSWFEFWKWGRTYPPNQEPMWHWAYSRLDLCQKKECSLSDDKRLDLHYADLRGVVLDEVNLRDADLSHAKLIGASLMGAVLTNADLSNADLTDANLSATNLTRANLANSDLTDANLSFTILTGANLSKAILTNADLRGNKLDGADLMGAELDGALLMNADLSHADLSGASLSNADLGGAHLDGQQQLNEACGTDAALPPGLTLKRCPPGWSHRLERSWSR
jgi:uncharacterized protein YjbI with pentapeptide repeats